MHRKRLLLGSNQTTTEQSSLMPQLRFVSMMTGSMVFLVGSVSFISQTLERALAVLCQLLRLSFYSSFSSSPCSWLAFFASSLTKYRAFASLLARFSAHTQQPKNRTVSGTAPSLGNFQTHFQSWLLPYWLYCPDASFGRRRHLACRDTSDGQCNFRILWWWQGSHEHI